MELTRSSLRLVVNGRRVTVGGEAYLPGHGSPDFVAYENTIVEWDDGTPITIEEKQEIARQILESAKEQDWNVEIE